MDLKDEISRVSFAAVSAVCKPARLRFFPSVCPTYDKILCGAEGRLAPQTWHEMSTPQTISGMRELILIQLKVYADPVIPKSISHTAPPYVCSEPLEHTEPSVVLMEE